MAPARTALALPPLAAPRSIDAPRAAPSTFRVAYASATHFPHVDVVAVEPVTIGRPPLRRVLGDEADAGAFETHWTRVLHVDAWTGAADASAAPSRGTRAARVGERVYAVVDAIVAFTREALARRRRRLKARAICDALRACDDRTLRDLGMHRSEIMSLAAEASGTAACTRERIHRMRRGPR